MTLSKQNWYSIIVAAIVVAVGFAGFNIHAARKAEKEQAMIYQLKQLREAVQLYEMVQKAKPIDLKAAMVVTIDGKVVPIQWAFEKDASGNPLDPFGAPYRFDTKSGWVKSGTAGYESW
ncbi:MAG: hypothetical protein COV45_00110 [Deltaproteobacteria bacterium CG11_big_fil_rev_8_21_14_0_20_47_16]|nr:MAG: hypothetical protein COV45_00110 [Deltaproteobacteria bacterium CG11_big_fil_rev_8_21_14_0_20_47_16]